MIPDDVVDRVRQEADIVAIVGEYVKLQRVENSYRGPCPFHHGRPELSVTSRGYNRFVCHESGTSSPSSRSTRSGSEAVSGSAQRAASTCGRSAANATNVIRRTVWEVNASAASSFAQL